MTEISCNLNYFLIIDIYFKTMRHTPKTAGTTSNNAKSPTCGFCAKSADNG